MNMILFLARFFGFLTLIPLLAQSFLRAQGLGSAESGIVLLYREYLNLGRKRSSRKKNPLKKTNPKRTQSNPIFWRPNPILSPKTGIFDKFTKTFLCKTNPMVCLRKEYETPKNIKYTKQSQFENDSDVRN